MTRILILLASLVLVLAVLTGCGISRKDCREHPWARQSELKDRYIYEGQNRNYKNYVSFLNECRQKYGPRIFSDYDD
jgi:hypothetical protein